MLRKDQRGFVLSGIALLLILPAMLLSASFLAVVETGGEGTSLQSLSDKVSYTGYSFKETVGYMEDIGVVFDNETFEKLSRTYEEATGIEIKKIEKGPFRIWENVHETWWDYESYPHYAWGDYCEIGSGPKKDSWYYSFEDLDPRYSKEPDADRNEPKLLVEELPGEKLRITIVEYGGGFVVDIHIGDQLLWENVNDDPNSPGLQGMDGSYQGLHIGENVVLSMPLQIFKLKISDLGNTVQYEEEFSPN